jgi:hypothetical protein
MQKRDIQLPPWINNSVEDDLITMLSLVKTDDELRMLLNSILTERELSLIACRLRAALLLFEGLNTLEVRELCNQAPNISRGVISRANQQIVKHDKGRLFSPFFERFKRYRQNG